MTDKSKPTTRATLDKIAQEAVDAMKAAEKPDFVEAFENWRQAHRDWTQQAAIREQPEPGPDIADMLALQKLVMAYTPLTLWGHAARFLASRAAYELQEAVDWNTHEAEDFGVSLPVGAIRQTHGFTAAALDFLKLG